MQICEDQKGRRRNFGNLRIPTAKITSRLFVLFHSGQVSDVLVVAAILLCTLPQYSTCCRIPSLDSTPRLFVQCRFVCRPFPHPVLGTANVEGEECTFKKQTAYAPSRFLCFHAIPTLEGFHVFSSYVGAHTRTSAVMKPTTMRRSFLFIVRASVCVDLEGL